MNNNDGFFALPGPGTVLMDTLSDSLGPIFWWFIFALFILLIIFVQFERIVKWGSSPLVRKRETFEVPVAGTAPSPCPEHDERCAQFPPL